MVKEWPLSPSRWGWGNSSVSNNLVERPHYGAAQKLICKKLGADDDYQSVVNVQKGQRTLNHAVKIKHIQLVHHGSRHWFL